MEVNLRDDFDTIVRTICVVGLLAGSQVALGQENLGGYSTELPIAISLPAQQQAVDQSLLTIMQRALESEIKILNPLPDIQLNDPYPITISGGRVQASVRGRGGIDSRGPWLEGWIGGLDIQMEKLEIDTVIIRQVSGVRARIHLKAKCRDLRLSWGASAIPFFVRSRLILGDNQPVLKFDQLSLSAIYDEPQASLSCEGPLGAEDMIKTEILKAVLIRWTDRSFLDSVQAELESHFDEALSPRGKGVSGFRTIAYAKTTSGSHLKGAYRVNFDRPVIEVPATDSLVPTSGDGQLTVRVAIANLESLLQSYFAPGVWSNWTIGADIPGFRDLMDSRFKQLFAFPDLMRYPKNAPFAFSTSMASRIRLACDAQSRQIEARADIGSWMVLQDSPGSGSLGVKPLVYFGLPSRIRVGRDFLPRVHSMSLRSQFHEKYLREESPDTNIAHDSILEGLQPEFEKLLLSVVEESGLVPFSQGLDLECDANTNSAIIRVKN